MKKLLRKVEQTEDGIQSVNYVTYLTRIIFFVRTSTTEIQLGGFICSFNFNIKRMKIMLEMRCRTNQCIEIVGRWYFPFKLSWSIQKFCITQANISIGINASLEPSLAWHADFYVKICMFYPQRQPTFSP